jgi:PAS domain S-box-containing protein
MLPSRRSLRLLALFVAALGIAASLLTWQALNRIQDNNLQSILDARLRAYCNLASAHVDSLEASLSRMGNWWTSLQRTPRLAWASDARAVLSDHPAVEELHWIDVDLVQRWSISKSSENWLGNQPIDEHRIAAEIARAERTRRPVLANLGLDANGLFYAEMIVPLHVNENFDGLLLAKINLTALLRDVYDDAELISAVEVQHNDERVFSHHISPTVDRTTIAAEYPLILQTQALNATLKPTEAFMSGNKSNWPDMVLLGLLLFTALVTVLVHQWGRISLAHSDLRQAQKALRITEDRVREQRAHLETTYNAAPFGICFFDLNLRYLSINQRLADFNGKSIEEHLGRTPREVRETTADQLEPILGYVIRTGQPVENVELQAASHADPDLTRCWLCSYHPAKDDNGQIMGVVVSILDITSLKEAESEKENLADQLHQSQKTEALGRLTGGIAHDFNNMLGVILGTLEFVADKITDEKIKPLIDRIRQAAERAGDLTQRLLAFARQQPLSPKTVDVGALITNLEKLLIRTLGEAIDIRCVTSPMLWKAEVDPSQLESAVLNLAINARDAMPSGGKLTIEAANASLDEGYVAENFDVSPGDYVVVSVTDTGTGMSPEVIRKAFEPFFTTKEVGKGSGLGLSMVQGFIKQSRGHVKIYSELGQGTVIKLYIPRSTAEHEADEGPANVPLEGGSEVVFVVEDDELMRDTAVLLLESLGYSVIVANSGVEALPIIESSQPIDILFTDIVMPGGIDGATLADRARVLRPGLKVVFSSGYTDNAITHQGRLPQGTHLVQKPYRRRELASKIRAVLDEKA